MDKPLFSKDAMQQAVPHDMQTRYRAAVEAIPPDDPILELIYAAQMLHDECAEYGRINLIGGYDNRSMVRIRAAINHAWRTPPRKSIAETLAPPLPPTTAYRDRNGY